ncbi:hypothetical protein B0T14DRAFT_2580 [Immersiella caudata]|uniref:Uncharacterized protein n=1 Tax=Immersiella caudata TaxID=314043 RepID=A0AA39XD05_9PEZI|nr:hypothetical protein B0T14DRAFT_2580 [Immersiella caudata]
MCACSRKMYRTQFSKWNWRKYKPRSTSNKPTRRRPPLAGEQTCLRSVSRRTSVKSTLLDPCTNSRGTPFIESIKEHATRLTWLRLPVDDEMSRHKFRTIRHMSLFLGYCPPEINPCRLNKSNWIMSGFYHGLGMLLSGNHKFARIYLDWSFSQISLVLHCSNWEALLKVCLLEPYSLLGLSLGRISSESCKDGPLLDCHRILDDALKIYLDYVTRLIRIRLGDHPMASAVAGMRYAFTETPGHWSHFSLFLQEEVIGEMIRVGRIHLSRDVIFLQDNSIVRCQV